jgi:excisionase family DNA binding protein
MSPIEPNTVYTTQETQQLLKVSKSTIKRLLKKGIIRANKIGGQYRILGREILRAVSPELESKAVRVYRRLKEKTKEAIKEW